MRWRGGGRPRKNWMSCGACWMSMRGEADEQLRELDFAGDSANARVDIAALPLARSGAGGAVCRCGGRLPKCVGALCAGSGYAGLDADFARSYVHLAPYTNESGR